VVGHHNTLKRPPPVRLGFAAVPAINNQDLPVIIGIVIVASAAVVVANIAVDVFYAVLDPRVRLH
jgi:peptide/nickel transport system permease protein